MFVGIGVASRDFHKQRSVAITETLQFKRAGRPQHRPLYSRDILHAKDPVVHACQDGSYKNKVTRRMIVFRPLIEEALACKISGSTPYGIKASMEFLDDIIIPLLRMQPYTI
ncbi:hypothetical protein BJ742DRAFT_816374 [Cladochytrium replicatum]|nr:hypothetical protein BJ742DRAFT_816374 [Cladochytrium replicatum]